MRTHRSGLSLVEVLAASTVLILGLGATFSSMGTADQTRRRTEDRNKALAAITSEIEFQQAESTTSMTTQSSIFYTDISGLTLPDSVVRPGVLMVEKLSPATDVFGCTVLRLRADWKSAGGDDHVEFIYYFTRRISGG
jgi:hypothetical protein